MPAHAKTAAVETLTPKLAGSRLLLIHLLQGFSRVVTLQASAEGGDDLGGKYVDNLLRSWVMNQVFGNVGLLNQRPDSASE
jgi:hypothetical protein